MEEIRATATYPVNPIDVYQRGNKTDGGKPGESSDTSQTTEKEPAGSSSTKDKISLSREAQQISELAITDRKVRTHEAAHSAAGGQYTGSPSYTYQQGPDGKRYAVAGEVPIDTSPVSGNPEATIKKAQAVRAAAQAPADPSAQDRQVAAAATRLELNARNDMQTAKREEATETSKGSRVDDTPENRTSTDTGEVSRRPLNLYA